jgi:hypothetical protein
MSVNLLEPPMTPPKPDDWNRKPLAVQIRGSVEWKAWLDRGAKACGLKIPSLVTAAVTEFLKRHGFDEAPPER